MATQAGPGLARVGLRPAATAACHCLPSGYSLRHHHRTSGTGTCSACCDRDPPDVAHTWVTVCMSAAGCGRRGQSRRTSSTNASLARWSRRKSSRPWQAGAVASDERHGDVLGSLRSRRTGCCTHVGRPAHLLRQLWQAGAVASRERHGDVLGSRRSRRAGCGAHVGCSVHILPPAVAGGCGSVAQAARARARLAAAAMHRVRHTRGNPANNPPQAVAGGSGRVARAARGRARLAAIATRRVRHTRVSERIHP